MKFRWFTSLPSPSPFFSSTPGPLHKHKHWWVPLTYSACRASHLRISSQACSLLALWILMMWSMSFGDTSASFHRQPGKTAKQEINNVNHCLLTTRAKSHHGSAYMHLLCSFCGSRTAGVFFFFLNPAAIIYYTGIWSLHTVNTVIGHCWTY